MEEKEKNVKNSSLGKTEYTHIYEDEKATKNNRILYKKARK